MDNGAEQKVIIDDDFKAANVMSDQTVVKRNIQKNTSGAIGDIKRKLYFSHNFKAEETGLYHPAHNSVVKLTNAGDVDIFTENNVGMNLDKRLQMISVYANTIKEHLKDSHRWLTGSDFEYIKGRKETHVVGLIYIDGEDNMEIKIKEDILASCTNLTINVSKDVNLNVSGNVTAKIKGHAKIDVEKDFKLHTKKDIEMIAEGDVRIDGSKLYIGM